MNLVTLRVCFLIYVDAMLSLEAISKSLGKSFQIDIIKKQKNITNTNVTSWFRYV